MAILAAERSKRMAGWQTQGNGCTYIADHVLQKQSQPIQDMAIEQIISFTLKKRESQLSAILRVVLMRTHAKAMTMLTQLKQELGRKAPRSIPEIKYSKQPPSSTLETTCILLDGYIKSSCQMVLTSVVCD
jgi:hypothetical protein